MALTFSRCYRRKCLFLKYAVEIIIKILISFLLSKIVFPSYEGTQIKIIMTVLILKFKSTQTFQKIKDAFINITKYVNCAYNDCSRSFSVI